MGYRIRVLSTSVDCIPLSALQSAIAEGKLRATISVEGGTSNDWTQLVLRHADGPEVAVMDRSLVEDGSFAAEELAEFTEEIADCKPANAVKWLADYFPRVRCIYCLQLLSGIDRENGWEILGAVKDRIWSYAPSIIQADGEGFTNEDGYHIVWQFSDSVDGTWWMGVLSGGGWKHFQMDLGNRNHRETFFKGQIPDGAKRA
jgi:hypothetical protein